MTTTSRPNGKSNAHLPAILCLHGSGSNSIVMKIQMRRLIWAFQSRFQLVFVEAPHTGEPGAGMLPVFESCAPFFRWVTYKFQLGEADHETCPANEVTVLDDLLRRTMEANGGVDKFVGVIGFSQGARVAAGLLLRQKMAERDGRECWTKLGFGVMVGGPFPPIALEENVDPNTDYEVLKTIPTVHAWGDKDFVRKDAKRLADVCDGPVSYSMEFDGDHHFPLKENDSKQLCDYIEGAWYAAGGK